MHNTPLNQGVCILITCFPVDTDLPARMMFPLNPLITPSLTPNPTSQAYTSQIVALTMMALLLGADSRAKSAKRLAAIRALAALPDAVREVRGGCQPHAMACWLVYRLVTGVGVRWFVWTVVFSLVAEWDEVVAGEGGGWVRGWLYRWVGWQVGGWAMPCSKADLNTWNLSSVMHRPTDQQISGVLSLINRLYICPQVLKLDGQMKKLAEQLKDAQDLIFFGRGYNYSTALEAALKVRGAKL